MSSSSTVNDTIALVDFTDSHVPQAAILSGKARWPHRAEDWSNILATSAGVVVIDRSSKEDKLVGTGLCSLFEGRARLNMIIVDAAMRGRGLGRAIVEALIRKAGDRPISLVATEDGLPLYRKLGFVPAGEIEQWQGILAKNFTIPANITSGSVTDIAPVLERDRAAYGFGRQTMLTSLVKRGDLFLSENGFAIRATFGRGTTIGPIVAQTQEEAQALLAAALEGLSGQFVRVDTDPALGLTPMLEDAGLSLVGGGTVMHRGDAPKSGGLTAYAMASQALG